MGPPAVSIGSLITNLETQKFLKKNFLCGSENNK